MEAAIQMADSGNPQASRGVRETDPIIFYRNTDCFFVCRHCRNHILSVKDLLDEDFDMKAIICKNPDNIHTFDGEVDPALDLFFDVHCNQCNSTLGRRIFMDTSSSMVPEGVFIFPLNKILYSNGRTVIYADTRQPVPDNN